jgi:hypothetical protein
MYLCSAFARANVSGANVAHGSSSRGAPSVISALVALAAATGDLARASAATTGGIAPGCDAQPTAIPATNTDNRTRADRILPRLRATTAPGSVCSEERM